MTNSIFEELSEINNFCKRKEKEIENLQIIIKHLKNERSLIRTRFLKGEYDLLKEYFNQEEV